MHTKLTLLLCKKHHTMEIPDKSCCVIENAQAKQRKEKQSKPFF